MWVFFKIGSDISNFFRKRPFGGKISTEVDFSSHNGISAYFQSARDATVFMSLTGDVVVLDGDRVESDDCLLPAGEVLLEQSRLTTIDDAENLSRM